MSQQPELNSQQRRDAAQKLATLLTSPDERALERFKKQRLGRDRTIGIGELALLRDILVQLAGVLLDDDEQTWSRARLALQALQSPADPPLATSSAQASPSPVGQPDTPAPPRPAPPKLEPLLEPELAPLPPEPPRPAIASVPKAPLAHVLPDLSDDVPLPLMKPTAPSPWALGKGQGLQLRHAPSEEPVLLTNPASAQPAPPLRLDRLVGAGPLAGSREAALAGHSLQATAITEDVPPRGAVLPFEPAEEATRQLSFTSLAHPLALSVKEYAGLCAERDQDPGRVKRVRARYGMDDERGMRLVDRLFQRMFEADPALRAQWHDHYRQYADRLNERMR